MNLSLEVTQTCAHPSTECDHRPVEGDHIRVAPPDINARFIAPFMTDDKNINNWIAGGNGIWFQRGFAIRSGSEWQKVYARQRGPGHDRGRLLG